MADFHTTQFCIDGLADTFEGYTSGEKWNGWECPYFAKSVAEQILELSRANGYSWVYQEKTDAFAVTHPDDPSDYSPEVFKAAQISTDDGQVTVYPVGAYSWSWRRCVNS
jgi:hypothetical protein